MKRATRVFAAAAVLTVTVNCSVFAQSITAIEFKNQPITDILLALAKLSGTSIVPDNTVTGNASYYFSNTSLRTALTLFLSTYHLYDWVSNGVYYVSKVRVVYDSTHNLVRLDANQVSIRYIIQRLSKSVGVTILYDALPQSELTLHVKDLSPEDVLKIIAARYPAYTVERTKSYYYLKHVSEAPPSSQETGNVASAPIKRHGDRYSITARRVRFRVAVRTLFHVAGKEYSLLGQNDPVLQNLYFENKPFSEMLRLILEQGQSDYSKAGDIYYIYDIQKQDVLKQFDSTVVIPLTYIAASTLPSLFPPNLASSNNYKIDTNDNSIILRGSIEQIGPIQRFIKQVDKPLQGKRYYRFDLSYLNVQDFIKILPKRLETSVPIQITGSNSFVMLLPPRKKAVIENYIGLVDHASRGVPIRLNYIQSSTLLKNLPPGITKANVHATGNQSVVFFTGSQDKRRMFRKDLETIDRPIPQIKYELLVIQHDQGNQFSRDISLTNSVLTSSDHTAFLGTIGKLLNLNFDIVSAFGYLFALNLNLSLSDSTARVLADTTLNGLSGQQIKFQNTDTYRYRDSIVNPDTGKLDPTGVVREITSGLIISIDGWVSGNNTITMNISSTISKQGTDTSGSSNALPPTTEKVISTHVRTSSGVPVVIGGLIEQDTSNQIDKIPFLGDIPILGLLFQKKVRSVQNTELTVYILPHIEHPRRSQLTVDRTLQSLYNQFVGGSPG